MIFWLLSISLLSILSRASDGSILYFEIHHPEGKAEENEKFLQLVLQILRTVTEEDLQGILAEYSNDSCLMFRSYQPGKDGHFDVRKNVFNDQFELIDRVSFSRK